MEILRTSDLDAYIDTVIDRINAGVAKARGRGIMADLPEEVSFQAIVISDAGWQALEAATSTSQQTQGQQGGGSETTGTDSTSETRRATKASRSDNAHNQNDEENIVEEP